MRNPGPNYYEPDDPGNDPCEEVSCAHLFCRAKGTVRHIPERYGGGVCVRNYR